MESDGFKKLLKRLKPDCFEDVVAAVALYRPGPLDAGMVDDYIDRKHGRKKIEYPHPVCEPILNMTYGVIVYQEQVMRIAVDLSGFTLGGADKLRKAMGKKKADVMEKLGKQFVDGAYEKSGMPREAAHELFENIKKFAGYAFNKSHSAAYAVITYQTAYLKYYYETEFMAALLSTEMRQQENVVKYIQSAREMGIPVLSPDVNQSDRDFSVVNVKVDDATTRPGILFGLGAIKGVGDSAIELILEERNEDGYESLFKLCEATDTRKVNKKVLEALVKSGACDTFGRLAHSSLVPSRRRSSQGRQPKGPRNRTRASSVRLLKPKLPLVTMGKASMNRIQISQNGKNLKSSTGKGSTGLLHLRTPTTEI